MGHTHVGAAGRDKAHGWDEEVAVTTTAIVILSPPNDRILRAWIQVLDADIVFADGGSTPSLTKGGIVPAGDVLVYEGDSAAMASLKARTEAGTARLRIGYYGY